MSRSLDILSSVIIFDLIAPGGVLDHYPSLQFQIWLWNWELFLSDCDSWPIRLLYVVFFGLLGKKIGLGRDSPP